MKILITGGAGYIGSKLCELLSKRIDVEKIYSFDNLYYKQGHLAYPLNRGNKKVEFYAWDVLEKSDELAKALDESDIIIPLAAIVGAPACDKIAPYATAINLVWIERIASSLKEGQLIIYPNTNSGYGTTGEGVCTEETPSNPISLYGKLKQEAENVLLDIATTQSICFRLATVFGWSYRPRIDLLVNNLTYEAVFNRTLEVFDGHFRRNYIHIDDICRAFLFAINNAAQMVGNVYNLGNDNVNMTKRELVDTIASITGCSVTENINKTDPDKRDYLVSSQKLYDLGFYPTKSLEDGVHEMIEFYSYLPREKELREKATSSMFNY